MDAEPEGRAGFESAALEMRRAQYKGPRRIAEAARTGSRSARRKDLAVGVRQFTPQRQSEPAAQGIGGLTSRKRERIQRLKVETECGKPESQKTLLRGLQNGTNLECELFH